MTQNQNSDPDLINPPSQQFLLEYDLTVYTYGILLACTKPISWTDLKQEFGASQSVWQLIDNGLLQGPVRGETLRSRPLETTEQGRTILSRLKRGLHQPEWLSESRIAALTVLAEQGELPATVLVRTHHIRQITLTSLVEHGYLKLTITNDQHCYDLTPLGQAAFAELN